MACASTTVVIWGGTPACGIGAYGFLANGHAEGGFLLIFFWFLLILILILLLLLLLFIRSTTIS